ncbi:guanylate cyclase 2G [Elysia marginata]|uniref:Guanylate cyclase 2G n=1 Tax=Elysia marginata TaxID=1093978 RepID=A0AAV4FCM3_9GAST|nr:guanylate cyclase 2G [Elysia marginata]
MNGNEVYAPVRVWVLNPNCAFPDEPIRVIGRAQKSGTTSTLTSALSAADSNWRETYGVFSKGMNPSTYEPYHWKSGKSKSSILII